MVARKTTRRKKSIPLPRKPKTGIAAAPTSTFHWFSDYIRTDVDKKEIAGVIRTYIKDNFKGKERTTLLSAPDYYYGEYGVASTIQWKALGFEWPENWDGTAKLKRFIDRVREASIEKILEKQETQDKVQAPVRSPMDIVKEKTSEFIGGVEEVLDDWENQSEYSLYNQMVMENLNSFSAKHVLTYYERVLEELDELVNKKTDDLVEAYSYMSVPQRKKLLAFVQGLVTDAERYVLSKKASRRPSKPKVKTADKQVSKLNYANESKEFKLTSINPISIVGAARVYTFHIKERIITEYVCERAAGFEVRGSTIYGIDTDNTRAIRLRKPEEQLSAFLTKTPAAINKFWDTLTTKTVKDVSGRVNKDTIILRALDK
jgi:hypothetical protein